MKAVINLRLLAKVSPGISPIEIRDKRLSGFILRVQPSGSMSYICEYARGKRFTIGKTTSLTPAQARDKAKDILADAVKGVDPMTEKKASRGFTLIGFLEIEYFPWASAHRKSSGQLETRLRSCFSAILKKRLDEITQWQLEKWRTGRLKNGLAPSTVNRDIAELKAALSKAVAWGFLTENPLLGMKMSKVDLSPHVRYLESEEENQLRKALSNRHEVLTSKRKRFNAWRQIRHLQIFPADVKDHLQPLVLLAMNTGMRRGELFNLRWKDVNFGTRTLIVRGATAKSGKTRYIPLNTEAFNVLRGWKGHIENSTGIVFKGKYGDRLNDISSSWKGLLTKARISNFRFHDLRHHFASKLVMAGVDLNTVRELLGHSDIKMTLRYAHLAPEHRAAAVEKIASL